MQERRPADDQRPRTTDEIVVRIGVGRALLAAVLLHIQNVLLAQATTVTCSSTGTGRQACPADTSKGVILAKSTGTAPCLLGKTWGYDDKGVWVADGCGGVFVVGPETVGRRSRGRRSLSSTSPISDSGFTRARRARFTCGFSATRAF